jgi:hypothetical protein
MLAVGCLFAGQMGIQLPGGLNTYNFNRLFCYLANF